METHVTKQTNLGISEVCVCMHLQNEIFNTHTLEF